MYNMKQSLVKRGWDRTFMTPGVCCSPGVYFEDGKETFEHNMQITKKYINNVII